MTAENRAAWKTLLATAERMHARGIPQMSVDPSVLLAAAKWLDSMETLTLLRAQEDLAERYEIEQLDDDDALVDLDELEKFGDADPAAVTTAATWTPLEFG